MLIPSGLWQIDRVYLSRYVRENLSNMIIKRRLLAKNLALLFVFAAILPLIAGGTLSIYSGFRFSNQEIATRQESIIALGNTYISTYVDRIFYNLNLIGNFTRNYTENARQSLEQICQKPGFFKPGFYQKITLATSQGQELYSLVECQPVASNKLTNISQTEAFFRAKQEGEFISKVSFVKDKPLVTISQASETKNGSQFVVIAVVKFENLWTRLSSLEPGKSSYFYIVDREGNLIGYKDITVVGERKNLASFPTVSPLIKRGKGITAKRYIGLLGVEVIGTSTLIRRTGWGIIVEQPVAQALAAPQRLILHFTLLTVAVSFVAIAAAIMLAQYIVRPINLLAQGAEAIAQGDLSYFIEINSKNEIGILAHTFNQMTRQLKISRETLEEYNRTLEQRVERRTKELKKSQQRLSLLFQQTPLAVIEFNTNFEVIEWNPAAEQIFGYTKDEAIGHHLTDLIVPENAKVEVNQFIEALLAKCSPTRNTNENLTKDGKSIICEWYSTPLIDSDGNAIGIASMALDITARKQVEEELRTSKEYLRLIIDNIPQQVFWKDTNLVFQGCNKNWAKSAQLENPEAVVGKTDYDLIPKREVAELFRVQDLHIMETDTPELHVIATKQKPSAEGKTIWLDISKIPIHDSTGKVIGIVGVVEDITDRKYTEAILQRQAAVIEAALDGISLLNYEGEFLYTNKAFAEINGYQNPAELIGKSWKVMYSEDDLQRAEQQYQQEILPALLKDRQWRGEKAMVRKDGRKISLEVLHYILESGEQVCITRDITARTQAESALREREEQYHSIFEATSDGLIINDFEGYVVEANTAACQMYGYPYEEFIGMHGSEFIHPLEHERALNDLQKLFKIGGYFKIQGTHVRKDGTAFPMEVHAMSFLYKGKLHMMSVIRDITERKQAEEAIRLEKEKSEQLLLNILPGAIADRLKEDRGYIADSFPEVTVLFADIVGFTDLSTRLSPTELVEMLNVIFSEFDRLAEKHGLEKIKTIGDAYMVVGGLPRPRTDHAEAIAEMALDMQVEIAQFNASINRSFSIRIGINSGPVVAGVIGIKKFIYDLWGDTVNTASRMESHGIPGCIQVTAATYEILQRKYLFEERGPIPIKGKGEMVTYFLTGRKALGDRP